MNHAPMSKIDDGTNDIAFMTMEKSRYQLTKLLLQQDDGNYFNKANTSNPGQMQQNLGLDYYKSNNWKIHPKVKGPVPDKISYELPKTQATNANAIYSIDGEVYPAQDIEGKVLKKVLPIYC